VYPNVSVPALTFRQLQGYLQCGQLPTAAGMASFSEATGHDPATTMKIALRRSKCQCADTEDNIYPE